MNSTGVVEKEPRWVDIAISNLLRGGFMLSVTWSSLGIVLTFTHHRDYSRPGRRWGSSPTVACITRTSVGGVIHGDLRSGADRSIVTRGCLLLIATPVARVAFSIVVFVDRARPACTSIDHDRGAAAVAVVVLSRHGGMRGSSRRGYAPWRTTARAWQPPIGMRAVRKCFDDRGSRVQRTITGIERVATVHLRDGIESFLRFAKGRLWREASQRERLQALSVAVRRAALDAMRDSERRYREQDAKRVYYFSMEFLMGRALREQPHEPRHLRRGARGGLGAGRRLRRAAGARARCRSRQWRPGPPGGVLPRLARHARLSRLRLRHQLRVRPLQADLRQTASSTRSPTTGWKAARRG